MHIILVHVVHSIQNSCIKYSTQNQHFAEMFTYSHNTNYNLNFYYFIVSILFDFGEISIIRQVMEFSHAEYSALLRRNSRNLRYRSSG
jgi:hypothetical protein